uniref:Uncharacterized protein n=1 Tax=Rhizophora mucronata TaxID=61149 RepID=A0A2P2QPB5_RHIMU
MEQINAMAREMNNISFLGFNSFLFFTTLIP